MTNLEWLRTLSAEELVDFINPSCNMCIHGGNCTKDCNCVEGKVEWLNEEHVPKIKPCANCGGKAIFVVDPMRINPELGCVQCCECHIRTSVGKKHDVVSTWNRRVNDGKVDGD